MNIKTLIQENQESVFPKDIYNFFYLWHTYNHQPELLETPYGKEILNYYLKNLKEKYISLFSDLIYKQLLKYIRHGRIDADFPKDKAIPGQSPTVLLELIRKTFRSDLKRRNDNWILMADYVVKLSNAFSPHNIFIWINQIYNLTHNTQTTIFNKFSNYYSELKKAFDFVANIKNIDALLPYIDKDLKELKNQ